MFLIENCHNFASTKETNDNLLTTKKIRTMTNYNFNAKKVLMSTIAAVAFSFVFTTSANANPNAGNPQKNSLEVRVKDNPNRIEDFFKQMLGIPRGGKIR